MDETGQDSQIGQGDLSDRNVVSSESLGSSDTEIVEGESTPEFSENVKRVLDRIRTVEAEGRKWGNPVYLKEALNELFGQQGETADQTFQRLKKEGKTHQEMHRMVERKVGGEAEETEPVITEAEEPHGEEVGRLSEHIEALHRQAEALGQRNRILWQTLQATIKIAENQDVKFEDSYLQEIEKLREEMERRVPESSTVAPAEPETQEPQEEDREPVGTEATAEQEEPAEEADGEPRGPEAEIPSSEERNEGAQQELTSTAEVTRDVKRASLLRRTAGLPVRIMKRAIPFIGRKKLEEMTDREVLERTYKRQRSTQALAAAAAVGATTALTATVYYHNPEFATWVNNVARDIQPYYLGITAAAQEALRIGGQTIADIRAAIGSGWGSIHNITLPSTDVGETLTGAIHSPELQNAGKQIQTALRNFIIEGQRLSPYFTPVKNFLSENGFDVLNSTLFLYIASKVRGLRKKGEVSAEQQQEAVREAVRGAIGDVLQLREEEVDDIATAHTS